MQLNTHCPNYRCLTPYILDIDQKHTKGVQEFRTRVIKSCHSCHRDFKIDIVIYFKNGQTVMNAYPKI